ncbi:MAG TPA: hypothetical protein LFW20_03845 [Rickettsia endosymbiont of Omalisus fontisbellaquei]|nr:hypothetical protein [Rickettsia endosymbiont of Omalisus fontisbellaquei]
MKLKLWLLATNITIAKFARMVGVSKANMYGYVYGNAIPRDRKVMERITIVTLGAVTADDFYRKELTAFERKIEKLIKNKSLKWKGGIDDGL